MHPRLPVLHLHYLLVLREVHVVQALELHLIPLLLCDTRCLVDQLMYVDLVLLDLGIFIMAEEGRGLPHVHLAGGGLHVVELDEVALRI